MTPAIAAAHIEALGGLQKGDPIVWARNPDGTIGVWGWMGGVLLNDVRPDAEMPVEQNMPVLLRALARQYGAKLEPGEVPTWGVDHEGRWYLSSGVGGRPRHMVFAPPSAPHAYDHEIVPTLTERLPRLEALATVIAWQVSR